MSSVSDLPPDGIPADVKVKAKSARIRSKQAGIKPPSKWPTGRGFGRHKSNTRDIND